MIVAIIDDSDDKIAALKRWLNNYNSEWEVVMARSFQSGVRLLKSVSPDVVLLDMTLPTSEHTDGRAEGRKRLLGGKEILAEMEFEGVNSKVVVCTQFDIFPAPSGSMSLDSLTAELKREYPDFFLGSIYFSHTDQGWCSKLSAFLEGI